MFLIVRAGMSGLPSRNRWAAILPSFWLQVEFAIERLEERLSSRAAARRGGIAPSRFHRGEVAAFTAEFLAGFGRRRRSRSAGEERGVRRGARSKLRQARDRRWAFHLLP